MSTPNPSPISDLSQARLDKLLARLADEEAKVAQTKAEADALAKEWGIQRGYGSVIKPYQMKRQLAFEAARS